MLKDYPNPSQKMLLQPHASHCNHAAQRNAECTAECTVLIFQRSEWLFEVHFSSEGPECALMVAPNQDQCRIDSSALCHGSTVASCHARLVSRYPNKVHIRSCEIWGPLVLGIRWHPLYFMLCYIDLRAQVEGSERSKIADTPNVKSWGLPKAIFQCAMCTQLG